MPTLTINHYYIAITLTIVSTACLATFILLRGWNQPLTRWLGIYTLLICLWASSWFGMVASNPASTSLFWAKVLLIPAALIPPAFLHFTQLLLNTVQDKKQILLRWTHNV